MVKNKNIKGITLISLVITIVIMLILATVSINLILGNNGLFSKTSQSANAYKLANAEEKVSLAVSASYDTETKLNTDELKDNINKIDGLKTKVDSVTYDLKINVDGFDFIINEAGNVTSLGKNNDLPENSFDHPQDMGKEVALKDGWDTNTVIYVKTLNGVEVTNVTKVATVYAVADGEGETVPIPQNFYYVGGTFDTGVIISDNEDDKYDEKTDKTTHEYTRNLKGNQFVWIPCTQQEYTKQNFGKQDVGYDTTTPTSELIQINKYGGFYVARYEAGLASTISEFKTVQLHSGTNDVYSKPGVPQSKAGIVPWTFIDWNNSNENSKKMYENNNYVMSGLITGTQWDVIIKIMKNKGAITESDVTNSVNIGNYRNNSLDYNGRLAKAYYSAKWYMNPFGDETQAKTSIYNSDNTYSDLLTTGASAATEKYHIFDMAGNVWEYTEENSVYSSTQGKVVRGGDILHAGDKYPICFRFSQYSTLANSTSLNMGFRVVLYIK